MRAHLIVWRGRMMIPPPQPTIGRIAWLGGFAKKEKAHLQVRSKPNKN